MLQESEAILLMEYILQYYAFYVEDSVLYIKLNIWSLNLFINGDLRHSCLPPIKMKWGKPACRVDSHMGFSAFLFYLSFVFICLTGTVLVDQQKKRTVKDPVLALKVNLSSVVPDRMLKRNSKNICKTQGHKGSKEINAF